MTRSTTVLVVLLLTTTIFSCTKSTSSSSSTGVNNNIDYSGKYTGNVTLTTTVLGRSGSQPQQLIIDVSKGDTSNQIKILFGGYLSKASLNGKHFTLQPISDNYFRITGYGDFLANNQMSITYIQTAINGSETIQYSGTITKF